jgi:hypothetical protein
MSDSVKGRYHAYNNDSWTSFVVNTQFPDGPVNVIGGGQRRSRVDNGYTRGQDLPNYHKRVRSGELMPQTYFRQFSTVSGEVSGSYDFYVHNPSNNKTDHYWSDPCFIWSESLWTLTETDLSAHIPTHFDAAVQAAAAKFYNEGFDALSFAWEIRDVIRLWVDAAKFLLSKDVPRLLAKGPTRKMRVKDISNTWLNYRYGWRIFLYDIHNINELIAHWNDRVVRHSHKKQYKSKRTVLSAQDMPWTTDGRTFNRLIEVEDQITVVERGVVAADIAVPKLQFNILQSGWELTTLSFVLDWFLQVGKAIAALNLRMFAKATSAAKGYTITVDRTSSVSPQWSTGTWGQLEFNASVHAELTCRFPCSIPLTPQLHLNLKSTKVIDLVTLLIQRIL